MSRSLLAAVLLAVALPAAPAAQTVRDSVQMSLHVFQYARVNDNRVNCGSGIYATWPDVAEQVLGRPGTYNDYSRVATEGMYIPTGWGQTQTNPDRGIFVPDNHFGHVAHWSWSDGPGTSIPESCSQRPNGHRTLLEGGWTVLNAAPYRITEWYAVFNVPNGRPIALFEWEPADGLAIAFDGSFESGLSHEVDNTAPGSKRPVVAYDWDYGDGQTGSGARPTHAYDDEGDYLVQLTVTDDDGQTSTWSQTVTVDAERLRVAVEVEPAEATEGDSLTLVATVTNAGTEPVFDVSARREFTFATRMPGVPNEQGSRRTNPTLTAVPLPAGEDVVVTRAQLAPGESFEVRRRYVVDAPASYRAAGATQYLPVESDVEWDLYMVTGEQASGDPVDVRRPCVGWDPDAGCDDVTEIRIAGPVVNSTGDDSDEDVSDATCDTGAEVQVDGEMVPECTLRAAIQEANARGGVTIEFDIPGEGIPVIAPATALPEITDAVVIDGSTQEAGRVHLSGASSGPADGLQASAAGGLEVRGLVITEFARFGIRLAGGSGHTVHDTWIGYLPDGTTLAPNVLGGIRVEDGARDSEIGGRTEASENRIYGGVSIVGDATQGIAVLRNRLAVTTEWMGEQIVGLPIDLADSGPTCATWSGAGASGPNLGMPAPRLLEIAPSVVRGRTRPGATVVVYRVNFAGTQRARYWARTVVPIAVAEADGDGAFTATLGEPLALGTRVTAAATDAQGNTSELAQLRRPVIFLPGVGGTWLVAENDDETLWIPTQLTDEGANDALARMTLTDEGLPRPDDPVRTDGVIESILGLSKVYGPALVHLQDAGYPGDPGNSARATNDLWRFGNDWRLTATGLAEELQTLIHQLTDGADDVARSCQVDLVAHSNGGVIASVYLRGLGAAEAPDRVHRVLTSGTPYLGAVQPAAAHTSGYLFDIEKSLPGLDLEWGRMLQMARTLPGAYALMPSDIYWAADRGLSGLSLPNFILEDMNGEALESNPATIDFMTRPKEVGGVPSGLARLGALWAQQRANVQAVVGDWRTYEGPPHVFRHVGNVEASTSIAFFLPDPPIDLPEGATHRDEEGDTDRHRGYRESLSPWRGFGDGTVPLVSATLGHDPRVGDEDYSGVDSPWVEPFEEYPCLHVPLVDEDCSANGQSALDRIVEVLKGGYSVVPARSTRSGPSAAPRELVYVWADAPVRVWLTDDQGNSTGPASADEPNRLLFGVPDAIYDATLLGASLSVPADRAYTVRAEAAGPATIRFARQRVAAGDQERVHVVFGDALVADGGGVRLVMGADGTPPSTPLGLDADGDGTFDGTLAPGFEVTTTSGRIPVPVPRPAAVTLTVPMGETGAVDLDFPDVSAPGWVWALDESIPWLTPTATAGTVPGAVTLAVDPAGLPGGDAHGTITATLTNGAFERRLSLPVRLFVSPPVSSEPPAVPTVTRLLPPAPNPTRGGMTLTADLAEPGTLELSVFDALGREVARLARGPHSAGSYRYSLEAEGLPAGVYVVRMTSAQGAEVQRFTVIR